MIYLLLGLSIFFSPVHATNYTMIHQMQHQMDIKNIQCLPLHKSLNYYQGMSTSYVELEKKENTYKQIHNKWFHAKTSEQILDFVYFALLISLIISLILFIFIRLIRKKVKNTNRELRLMNKKLQQAIHTEELSIWEYDLKKDLFYNIENDAFSKKGISLKEKLKTIHPNDQKLFIETFHEITHGELTDKTIRIQLRSPHSQRWEYFETRFTVLRFYNGQIKTIIGTQKNITKDIRYQNLLKDSIRKTESAIKALNIVFWEFDCNTQMFKSYNEPINDYNENQLITLEDYYIHTHPDDLDKLRPGNTIMLQRLDKSYSLDVRIKTKYDKDWRFCSIIGIPFNKDEQSGLITQYIGFRRDNTEVIELNREVREYANKIRYILSSSGILSWDYNLNSKTINIYSGKETLESHLTLEEYLSRLDTSEHDKVCQLFTQMDKGEIETFSNQRILLPIVNTDTQLRYAIINGIPIKNEKGEVIKYSGLRRDITDLIMTQQSLKDEKEKAMQADKLKSAFLANMSHEIRTPLNAIVGFSELLQTSDDPQEKAIFMQIINTNNNLLLRLINDILDLSKIESGIIEIRRTEFDLVTFFEELSSSLQQRINNPEIQFISEKPPYTNCIVYLDRNRLSQIFTNFTTNAIKYTLKGEIKIGYTCEEDGIRIYVKDTGIGIPIDKQNRIFQRFEKLDNFAQGTGLGLSICKAIIDASKGKIGFTSEEGCGSTFWAWISCTPKIESATQQNILAVPHNTPNQQPIISTHSKKKQKYSILVAEDNDSNYLLVKAILKDHQLTRAINGTEVIELAFRFTYDAILMDMNMPQKNGLESTQIIRENDKDIPIIIISANAFETDKVNAYASGCNDFIVKPFKRETLLNTLKKHIK